MKINSTTKKTKKPKVTYSSTNDLVEAVTQSTLHTSFNVHRKIRDAAANDDPELAEIWSKTAQNLAVAASILLESMKTPQLAMAEVPETIIPAWEVYAGILKEFKKEQDGNHQVTDVLDEVIRRIQQLSDQSKAPKEEHAE